jgi:hypothetical protein
MCNKTSKTIEYCKIFLRWIIKRAHGIRSAVGQNDDGNFCIEAPRTLTVAPLRGAPIAVERVAYQRKILVSGRHHVRVASQMTAEGRVLRSGNLKSGDAFVEVWVDGHAITFQPPCLVSRRGCDSCHLDSLVAERLESIGTPYEYTVTYRLSLIGSLTEKKHELEVQLLPLLGVPALTTLVSSMFA